MSAVIKQTKRRYLQVFMLEWVIALFLTFIIVFFYGQIQALSVFLGCVAAILPQMLFIYWGIFRQKSSVKNRLNGFYFGEILKWSVTIFFIAILFNFYQSLDVLTFFIGYILFLVLNGVFPIYINKLPLFKRQIS